MTTSKYLDGVIPLNGVSHADVVRYDVDIPMRYAECYATLANGRKARMLDSSQFIGWSEDNGERAYIFRSGRRRIEIRTNAEPGQSTHQVISWPSLVIGTKDLSFLSHDNPVTGSLKHLRKIVARDGSLMVARRWGQAFAKCIGYCGPTATKNAPAPDGVFGGASI